MANLPIEVIAAFEDRESTKILATVDKHGVPNVTVKGSMSVMDDSTLIFADVGGDNTRTKRNMKETKKVAVLVAKGMVAYQVKGTFKETQTSGPLFDQFAAMLKTMANVDIKDVDLISVDEVDPQASTDLANKLA